MKLTLGCLLACGLAVPLAPAQASGWTLNELYSFDGGNNGGGPLGGPVATATGDLYDTTDEGGQYGLGVVYEILTNGTYTSCTILPAVATAAIRGQTLFSMDREIFSVRHLEAGTITAQFSRLRRLEPIRCCTISPAAATVQVRSPACSKTSHAISTGQPLTGGPMVSARSSSLRNDSIQFQGAQERSFRPGVQADRRRGWRSLWHDNIRWHRLWASRHSLRTRDGRRLCGASRIRDDRWPQSDGRAGG